MQTIRKDIHGPAKICAVRLFFSKQKAQVAFCIGGCHSENAGEPAPENRTGASVGNSSGNANDVAGAKRGSERGCQGSKAAETVTGGILFHGKTKRERKLSLNSFRMQGKEDMYQDKKKEKRTIPKEAVNLFQDGKHGESGTDAASCDILL